MNTPDFKCSMVAAAHITSTSPINFRSVMESIRSEQWAKQVKSVREAYEKGGKDAAAEPKKRLPGVLFSGTFAQRNAAGLQKHSGLICVDLDGLNGTTEAMKERIASDSHTLAAFTSPTGSGLKVIFRCNPLEQHATAYTDAEHYVLEKFGLEIDPACKDVSRLCFVSHDPEAFVADDAEPLPHAPAQPTEFHPPTLNLDLRPGDDFDSRHDLHSLLLKHGWTECVGGYTRPGKTSGLSATFNKVPGRFHVFSSNAAPFQENHNYKPWHAYAILEHGGDFSAAAKALAGQGYGQPSRQQKNLDRLSPPDETVNPPSEPTRHRSPFSFTIPAANDPSILLGNRYLNRGDGMVVSSSSGMGKSSMSNQMAADWALGEPFHGIRSNGPLRSLIIQSEDSDGDIAEVWQSLNHVRQWSDAQRAQIDTNVRIISERALRGVEFLNWLKGQIEEFKPDLVWLNPLQAFIDGDVTASKDLGFFLREGLNGINRDNKFGYVIIHHTTKPATGKDRHERLWHEQMYDMAGGAEIINWARSIISLRPTEEEGKFKAILAKRGRRAGVVRPVPQGVGERLEPVTTIGLKHATGKLPNGTSIIYWESCDVAADAAPVSKGGGRPPSHHFADYRSVFPPKKSIGLPLNQLQRLLDQQRPIKKDALFRALKRWADDGDVEIVNDPGKSDLYRAAY